MPLLRKSLIHRRSCIILSIFLCVTIVQAETNLEKALRQYNDQSVQGYVQPIADLFGSNMNAGLFNHSANIPSGGFSFRLDIIAMAALVGDAQTTYDAKAPAGFGVSTFKTATVFGDKGTLIKTADGSLQYRGSDGVLNTSVFPFAAPQVTIGNLYGTEAFIRYVPIPETNGLPKITLFGIGARHSISQYLPNFPIDIAVGGMYNKFTLGDIISVKGISGAIQASKELSLLMIYGGIQFEKSTLTLSFKTTDPTATSSTVNVNLDGTNVVRGVLGAGFNLGPIKLFADANFGAITSFSGGIGFGGF